MVLGNTPRRETPILLEAGKSYALGLQFQTSDGTPIDMSDNEVRFVAAQPPHRGGAEVLSLIATGDAPDMGSLQFSFQAEDLALAPMEYLYDVTVIAWTGYSIPVLKGTLEVGPNMDFDTSNSYSVPGENPTLRGSTITIPPKDVITIIWDQAV